jgi:REP element-mobilizing transposase RayT
VHGGDETPEVEPDDRLSLFEVMERFKSLTTYRYGQGVRNDGWPPYRGRLWQRDYYERVIRNEAELTRFRNYIEVNPARWFEDPYRS